MWRAEPWQPLSFTCTLSSEDDWLTLYLYEGTEELWLSADYTRRRAQISHITKTALVLIDSVGLILPESRPGSSSILAADLSFGVAQILDLGWNLLQPLCCAGADRACGSLPDLPEPAQGAPHDASRRCGHAQQGAPGGCQALAHDAAPQGDLAT